ncbi:MAG: carbohydrate kinase family protein [Firmicutes bacterium]|nr:carbohydrate kinase family protein [Bacillota bacterium]
MLDIVGIGALNIDFTVTAEKMKELPPFKVSEAARSFQFGAECLVDESKIEEIISLLGRDSFRTTLGGSAFNTICAMAALGSGIRAGFSGMAGAGCGSLSFQNSMDELSVDRTWLGECGGESSGMSISINQSGTRSFIHYPGCNRNMADFLKANYSGILKYASEARLLHLTQFSSYETAAMLEKLIKESRSENPLIMVSCDPGYAWLRNLNPSVEAILRLSDIIFLNEKEFSLLSGGGNAADDRVKAEVILSMYGGPATMLVVKKETEIKLYSPSIGKPASSTERNFAIDVISIDKISDATGAGDVFAAGFLTALLLGGSGMAAAVGLGIGLMRARLTAAPENLRQELERVFREWKPDSC